MTTMSAISRLFTRRPSAFHFEAMEFCMRPPPFNSFNRLCVSFQPCRLDPAESESRASRAIKPLPELNLLLPGKTARSGSASKKKRKKETEGIRFFLRGDLFFIPPRFLHCER